MIACLYVGSTVATVVMYIAVFDAAGTWGVIAYLLAQVLTLITLVPDADDV